MMGSSLFVAITRPPIFQEIWPEAFWFVDRDWFSVFPSERLRLRFSSEFEFTPDTLEAWPLINGKSALIVLAAFTRDEDDRLRTRVRTAFYVEYGRA